MINDQKMPDYLPSLKQIEVGERVFYFDTEAQIIRITAPNGPFARRAVAELDIASGLALYTEMRAEELTRQDADAATTKDEEAAEYEDIDADEAASEEADVFDATGLVSVFSEDALKKSQIIAKSQETERRIRFETVLKSASQNRGYRACPASDIAVLARIINDLRDEFPNFGTAIDVLEAALALSIGDHEYTIPPLLVHGEPGIGKTTFSMAIADHLGVPFDMVSAGSLQAGFDLAGTSSHWSNASAGRVVRLLAESHSASPVLLIDEVDKIGGDERYSPVNTMLDLLEPRTAKRFRDEALQLQFDASRMILLMTANDLGSIPATLLSRSQVVEIMPLSKEQRFAIVRNLVDQHARDLIIDDATVERIGTTGDLRKVQQTIKKAAGLAKARGDSALFFSVLAHESQPDAGRRIGF